MPGFPNPAEEAVALPLDLNHLVIKSPASTFFMRVDSADMVGMGIHSGDLLSIDRSLNLRSGDVVVVAIEGVLLLRQYRQDRHGRYLVTAGRQPKVQRLAPESDLQLWGVVTTCIRSFRGEYAV